MSWVSAFGTTADPKVINADDNTSAATAIAEVKGINEAVHSVDPVSVNATGTEEGSTSLHHVVLAATNNATSLKATAGQVYAYDIGNPSGAPFYVKFYDKATAPDPTTDTVIRSVQVPAGGRSFGQFSRGLEFTTGIAYAVVAGIGDTDNTAVGAADGTVNVEWI